MTTGREPTPCESHLWTFGYPIPCKWDDGHDGEHRYDTTPPLPGHPLYDDVIGNGRREQGQ